MITKGARQIARPSARPLQDWTAELTRSEKAWSGRPECPMLPRVVADYGFLRDRLCISAGIEPLFGDLSDLAVEATLNLMLRRGHE